jgi:hypothetical protein
LLKVQGKQQSSPAYNFSKYLLNPSAQEGSITVATRSDFFRVVSGRGVWFVFMGCGEGGGSKNGGLFVAEFGYEWCNYVEDGKEEDGDGDGDEEEKE